MWDVDGHHILCSRCRRDLNHPPTVPWVGFGLFVQSRLCMQVHLNSVLSNYLPHVRIMPIAAANMIAAVAQPKMLPPRPLTLSPITFRLFETSMMTSKSGGESNPLMTAVQKSADMGFIPAKFISMPISVEAAITV